MRAVDWMRRILILERQAVVATDLAEGLQDLFVGVEIVRPTDSPEQGNLEFTRGKYDLALVADGYGMIEGSPATEHARQYSDRVVVVGGLDSSVDDTGDIAVSNGSDNLSWPFTDDSLRNLIARITAAP